MCDLRCVHQSVLSFLNFLKSISSFGFYTSTALRLHVGCVFLSQSRLCFSLQLWLVCRHVACHQCNILHCHHCKIHRQPYTNHPGYVYLTHSLEQNLLLECCRPRSCTQHWCSGTVWYLSPIVQSSFCKCHDHHLVQLVLSITTIQSGSVVNCANETHIAITRVCDVTK
jgi:hypothetical protein